jgi:hypothetical protein
VAINQDVDCTQWRASAATSLSISQESVLCQITQLPFDPSSLGAPPPGLVSAPRGSSNTGFPVAAIIGIAVGLGGTCCLFMAGFAMYRRRRKQVRLRMLALVLDSARFLGVLKLRLSLAAGVVTLVTLAELHIHSA